MSGEKEEIKEESTNNTPQTFWRKLWWFIWEDNSIWSWIVNVILAFVIIKFLVYPGLGLALGTTHPIVAVVSGSMEHDGSFDTWWESECCVNGMCTIQNEEYSEFTITKEQFRSFRFKSGFNKGDLMILKRASDISLGDTVVFVHPDPKIRDPIIHRTVSITDSTINTKGDHNCFSGDFEKGIAQDGLVGEAVMRIPFFGWLKIGAVEFVGLFRGG